MLADEETVPPWHTTVEEDTTCGAGGPFCAGITKLGLMLQPFASTMSTP
jgi:hypothetical protein